MGWSKLLLFAFALLFVNAVPCTVAAQSRDADPLRVADEMFNRFVPMATEADEQALAEITVSPLEEQRLGEEMVKTFLAELKRQKIKVRRAGKDVEYVQALVETLRSHMRNSDRYEKIDIYFVESEIPEARSFPGGTLFFFEGIFEIARSEAAMVGVVAHELSHLDRGHQLLPIKQMRLMEQSISGQGPRFDPLQFVEGGTRIARLMSRPFRPQDEAAADEDAVNWSYAAGYDPREFAQLLLRLNEYLAKKNSLALPAFLRTHPPTLERADAAIAQFDRIHEPGTTDLYIGTTNLKRRIPRSEKEFAE